MLPFSKTLHSLRDPRLLLIITACAFLGIIVVVSAVAGITWLAATFFTFEREWLNTLVTVAAGIIGGIGGWFMLPVVVVLIGGIFQETVIHQVEKRDYPERVRKEEPTLWPDLQHDIFFTLRALLLNLLVLPFYLFAIGPLLSIALNSYLLGREFFETAAGHHLGKPAARKLGREHRKTVYGGGLVITCLTLLPVLNLIVPVMATVWMVHAYHAISKEPL